MENINVKPCDVWAFFFRECLDGIARVIASNDEFGVEIIIRADESRMPVFEVYCDDDMIEEEFVLTEPDCRETASRLYSTYLTAELLNVLDAVQDAEEKAFIEASEESLIADREDELDFIFEDFISAISPGCHIYGDDFEEFKDKVLTILAQDYDAQIYRPMYLEDEDGEEFFEEYPYECMVFDDEEEAI